jgi:hypothetical protein
MPVVTLLNNCINGLNEFSHELKGYYYHTYTKQTPSNAAETAGYGIIRFIFKDNADIHAKAEALKLEDAGFFLMKRAKYLFRLINILKAFLTETTRNPQKEGSKAQQPQPPPSTSQAGTKTERKEGDAYHIITDLHKSVFPVMAMIDMLNKAILHPKHGKNVVQSDTAKEVLSHFATSAPASGIATPTHGAGNTGSFSSSGNLRGVGGAGSGRGGGTTGGGSVRRA